MRIKFKGLRLYCPEFEMEIEALEGEDVHEVIERVWETGIIQAEAETRATLEDCDDYEELAQ